MNIKDFAKLTGFSVDTLRYYEKIGLFDNVKRDNRGYRDYKEKDAAWADLLFKLKSTGMSIENMKLYAELAKQGANTIPARRKMFEEHRDKVLSHLNTTRKMLEIVEYKIAMYKKIEKNMEN